MKIPVILQAEAVEKSVDSVEKFWDFTTLYPYWGRVNSAHMQGGISQNLCYGNSFSQQKFFGFCQKSLVLGSFRRFMAGVFHFLPKNFVKTAKTQIVSSR